VVRPQAPGPFSPYFPPVLIGALKNEDLTPIRPLLVRPRQRPTGKVTYLLTDVPLPALCIFMIVLASEKCYKYKDYKLC